VIVKRRISIELDFDDRHTDLDDLHSIAGSPVTSRLSWWRAAVDADPRATPMVFKHAAAGGAVDAAALLMVRTDEAGTLWLTNARPRSDDAWEITARSPRALRELAAEMAEEIGALEHPWRLELTGLRDGDATLDALSQCLPQARLLPANSVPKVSFRGSESVSRLLRGSVRDGLARSARRIARDGLREEISFERRVGPLLEMRAGIEAAHRARDHDAGRVSELDDEPGRRFWRSAYDYHAERGELEVATLCLDGQLAAYVIAFVDAPVYRVFDGRHASAYGKYSPGRRLETAALDRAFRDPSLREVDWMSSVAPETLIATTGSELRWTLVAASCPPASRERDFAVVAGY
jgi:GNAT acetyltransferase-like protein